VYSSTISWLSQERVWIPLVIARIGTSSSGSSGHSSFHIAREVSAWSFDTPFANADDRRANTVIPNSFDRGVPDWPRARNSSHGIPSGRIFGSRYFRSRSGSNRSFPAGTGVWVVKTPVASTTSRACAKVRPCDAIRSRIRSTTRNAECPSFMWYTVAWIPRAFSARAPPTPSRISCRMRMSRSPPYRVEVISRDRAEFALMLLSSRNRGVRPTSTRQTRVFTISPPTFTAISRWRPSAAVSIVTGMLYQSLSGYSSFCHPSSDSTWRKYPFWYKSPTPTSGTPRSEADFRWSPERTPSPPE
jgi:hypothetical protein